MIYLKGVSKLHLFESEYINITQIHTVSMFESKNEFGAKKTRYYSSSPTVYELIFFINGESFTHFAGTDIRDTPDSLRYLPKGTFEGEYRVERINDGVCIDIFFDTCDIMPDFAIGLKNMKELKPLFLKIYNVWNSKKSGFYAESMAILYEIIGKIKKRSEKYYPKALSEKIIPSHNYLLEHFCDNDFNYNEMCSRSGLSYDYFKELFIKKYGISPVKYITRLRIEKSCELLITGRYTISEIADMCGFSNVYYFSNVFKKQLGVSPTNFQKKK